jgi:hypothetical protein
VRGLASKLIDLTDFGVFGVYVLLARRYLPERRLLAITGPVSLFADCVPAGLMLPVVVALACAERAAASSFSLKPRTDFCNTIGGKADEGSGLLDFRF